MLIIWRQKAGTGKLCLHNIMHPECNWQHFSLCSGSYIFSAPIPCCPFSLGRDWYPRSFYSWALIIAQFWCLLGFKMHIIIVSQSYVANNTLFVGGKVHIRSIHLNKCIYLLLYIKSLVVRNQRKLIHHI